MYVHVKKVMIVRHISVEDHHLRHLLHNLIVNQEINMVMVNIIQLNRLLLEGLQQLEIDVLNVVVPLLLHLLVFVVNVVQDVKT